MKSLQTQNLKTNVQAPFLPRFIIVVPDWDIVKYVGHYKYGVTIITKKIVRWMVTNMSRSIQTHKDDLSRTKKGAVTPSEPKFVWV